MVIDSPKSNMPAVSVLVSDKVGLRCRWLAPESTLFITNLYHLSQPSPHSLHLHTGGLRDEGT